MNPNFQNRPMMPPRGFPFRPPVQNAPVEKPGFKYWKIVWISLGVLAFLTLVLSLAVVFWPEKVYSEQELALGFDLELDLRKEKNRQAVLNLYSSDYYLRLDSIERGFVNLAFIDKELITRVLDFSVSVGQTKKLDFDGDDYYDLSVRLVRVRGDVAVLQLRSESGKVCYENWQCEPWLKCNQRVQQRTCVDLNQCGTTQQKPEISRACTLVCTEDWKCSEWGECVDGKRIRTCIDEGECGTFENQLELEQEC